VPLLELRWLRVVPARSPLGERPAWHLREPLQDRCRSTCRSRPRVRQDHSRTTIPTIAGSSLDEPMHQEADSTASAGICSHQPAALVNYSLAGGSGYPARTVEGSLDRSPKACWFCGRHHHHVVQPWATIERAWIREGVPGQHEESFLIGRGCLVELEKQLVLESSGRLVLGSSPGTTERVELVDKHNHEIACASSMVAHGRKELREVPAPANSRVSFREGI